MRNRRRLAYPSSETEVERTRKHEGRRAIIPPDATPNKTRKTMVAGVVVAPSLQWEKHESATVSRVLIAVARPTHMAKTMIATKPENGAAVLKIPIRSASNPEEMRAKQATKLMMGICDAVKASQFLGHGESIISSNSRRKWSEPCLLRAIGSRRRYCTTLVVSDP